MPTESERLFERLSKKAEAIGDAIDERQLALDSALTRMEKDLFTRLQARQDMAAILDISPETASRVCSQLLLRGWLHESSASFEIDRAQLQRLAAE